MKIGVVSDTHGCVQTWREMYAAFLNDADLIIHAGDVLYHGPRNTIPEEYNPQQLAAELNNCAVPMIIVQGNCDAEVDGMLLDIPITKSSLIYVNGLRIFVRHGHDLPLDQAAALGRRYRLDILISGHTHLPVLQRQGGTLLLNPGSSGMSKREDRRGTFAVIHDDRVEVIYTDTGETMLTEAFSEQ